VSIGFSNGEKRIFDCKPYLNGDWFEELLEQRKFASVRIAGNTIEWAGGKDICPDCLYDISIISNESPLALTILSGCILSESGRQYVYVSVNGIAAKRFIITGLTMIKNEDRVKAKR